MDYRTDEIRKEDEAAQNYELLEELDNLLDSVDRVLLSMKLGREQKQILTGLTYKMYALAETAVIAEDPATQ